jgi:hypothetical protein
MSDMKFVDTQYTSITYKVTKYESHTHVHPMLALVGRDSETQSNETSWFMEYWVYGYGHQLNASKRSKQINLKLT